MANQPTFNTTGYDKLGPIHGPFSKGMQMIIVLIFMEFIFTMRFG